MKKTSHKTIHKQSEEVFDQPLRWFKKKKCDRLKLQIGYPSSDGSIKWEFIKIAYEDPSEEFRFTDKNEKRDKASRYRTNSKSKRMPTVEVVKTIGG